MFTVNSLHVSFEFWGAVFCLIAASCVNFSYLPSKKEKHYLISLLIVGALLLVSDAFAWYFRGSSKPEAYFWVRFANFMVYMTTDVELGLTTAYISFRTYGEKEYIRHNGYLNACMAVLAVNILALILSQYNQMIYYIDDANIFHRSDYSFIVMVCPAIILVLNFIVLIKKRDKLSKRMFLCMMLCLVLPVLATVYQAFHYGVSYVNIALIIALINLFVNVIAEQGETLSREVSKLNDMKVELMLSQIGPHFIYNALSTIKHFCRTDPKQAEETIDDFSIYLRGNLDALTENRIIPFTDELHHVKAYLAVERKRFGERLNVVYDIQESDFMIPALTLQPIVENSVKYGICAQEKGGTVTIQTRKENSEYVVVIQDDGRGFDPEKAATEPSEEHIGIRNVQERLAKMCGGSLTFHTEINRGTIVRITIPVKERGKTDENSSSR